MKQWCNRIVLAAGILGFSLFAQNASAQNLITNGTFDALNYNGWEEIWNFGAGGSLGDMDGSALNNWGFETSIPFQGSASAKNFFDGGIYQAPNVTGGQQYQFSLSMYVPTGGGSTTLWGTFANIKWLDSVGTELASFSFDGDAATRGQWNSFSQILNAPAAAVKARVEIGTFQSGVTPANPTRFDNVSLVAVPEPSTYGMLALGLGMLIPAVRRRIKAQA